MELSSAHGLEDALVQRRDDQAKAFLDSEVWLRVATLDSDQTVWNLPTHFVRIEDAIYFDEAPDSLMLRNIESHQNACAVADTGYSYDDLVGTILQGDAKVVDDQKEIAQATRKMTEKYSVLTRRPPVQDFAGRVFVKISPYQSLEALSWNFGRGHL